MAEAATNTRPSRARKPATATAAKAAPAKATPAKAAAPAAEKTEVDRFTVEFDHFATTKAYERFKAPESMRGVVVGSVYAPPGTARVAVLVVGATGPAAADE